MDPLDWINEVPPITRSWLCLSLLVNASATLDIIPHKQLLFRQLHQITLPNLELWRIVTSFCYTGLPLNEFHSLILLYLVHIHMKGYESNPHPAGSGNRTVDCAFGVLCCALGILLSHLCLEHFQVRWYLLTANGTFMRSMVHCVMYLWSRRNPHHMIQLNFIPIQGVYLPFAHLAFHFLTSRRIPMDVVHGFVVGHVYYWFMDVLPVIIGRPVLTAPRFLSTLLLGAEYQVPVVFPNNTANMHHFQQQQQQQQQQIYQTEGATPAHIAAKTGRLDDIRRLAQSSPEILHATDNNSWQPLHEAVRGGYLDIVEFLVLEQQVDVNARTGRGGNGPSPLWIAESFHGEDHLVTRRLVELGAVRIAEGERR